MPSLTEIDISESVEEFLLKYSEKKDVRLIGNDLLVKEYYRYIGVTEDIDFKDWIVGLAFGDYPAYTVTRNAIKTARNKNPNWIRKK